MGYHTTYLIKRILSSVATTLVYVAVDSLFDRKSGKRRNNYYYRRNNLQRQNNNYYRQNNLQRRNYVTPKNKETSRYMRDRV